MKDLYAVRIELSEANEFIAKMHRHHKPVQGHRFSIGVANGNGLCGVAVVGRPVARMTDQKYVAEVTRLATDGTRNACSFLYSRAARIAEELAFTEIQTFILKGEPGTSLKACGWECIGDSAGGDWNRPSRGGRRTDQPMEPKVKWRKRLNSSSLPRLGGGKEEA